MAKKKHHYMRRRNPFGAGSMNKLAVKVAGGLVGGIAAATVPNLSPTLGSGIAGIVAAGVISFGGAWILKGSADFSEGWLIGGLLQTAGRITQQFMGKNVVSFSLGTYGPLNYPLPTPAYNVAVKSGPQMVASIPASAGQAKPVPMRPTGTRSAAGGASAGVSGVWGRRAGAWG